MKLESAVFTFTMPNNENGWIYSAHWYPSGSDYYNTTAKLNRKFEVAIFRGGGYKTSYYTDHRICEKNSKEFIERYLQSLKQII